MTDICSNSELPLGFIPQTLNLLDGPTQSYPVTSKNLNYAGVAVGVVLLFSFGWCAVPPSPKIVT